MSKTKTKTKKMFIGTVEKACTIRSTWKNSMNTVQLNTSIHLKWFHRIQAYAVPIRIGHVTIDNEPRKLRQIFSEGVRTMENYVHYW